MSTPNTVKTQLQNLIDFSNSKTGKSDTDLTSAVNTLINERDSLIDGSITEVYSEVTSFARSYALAYLSNLKKIILPSIVEVNSNAFRYCNGLTDVYAPNALYLFNEAFYHCINLKYIDLPKLISIGENVFSYDNLFDTIVLRNVNTVVSLSNTNAFSRTLIVSGTGFIYVPRNLIEEYKTATNWVTYASQFRALEDYTVDGTIDGELDWDKVNGGAI